MFLIEDVVVYLGYASRYWDVGVRCLELVCGDDEDDDGDVCFLMSGFYMVGGHKKRRDHCVESP